MGEMGSSRTTHVHPQVTSSKELIRYSLVILRGVIHEFAELARETMKIRGTRCHLVPRFRRSHSRVRRTRPETMKIRGTRCHLVPRIRRRRRRIMFSNHRLLKVVGVCFVMAGFLLASLTTVRAQSTRAKSAAAYFARGSEWRARREFDRAIDDYGIAIAFDPSFAQAYYARARARLAKGDVETALGDFNHAIELDPRHAAAYKDRCCGRGWAGRQRPKPLSRSA